MLAIDKKTRSACRAQVKHGLSGIRNPHAMTDETGEMCQRQQTSAEMYLLAPSRKGTSLRGMRLMCQKIGNFPRAYDAETMPIYTFPAGRYTMGDDIKKEQSRAADDHYCVVPPSAPLLDKRKPAR